MSNDEIARQIISDMNLYRVNLEGKHKLGTYYVLSDSLDDAYRLVKNVLDGYDFGFEKDRKLSSIDVVARGHKVIISSDFVVYEDK